MAKGKGDKSSKGGKGSGGKGSGKDVEEEVVEIDNTAKAEALKEDMGSKMQEAVKHFDSEAGQLRTGRADPSLLDSVKVKAYDAELVLSHVCQVTRVFHPLVTRLFHPLVTRARFVLW